MHITYISPQRPHLSPAAQAFVRELQETASLMSINTLAVRPLNVRWAFECENTVVHTYNFKKIITLSKKRCFKRFIHVDYLIIDGPLNCTERDLMASLISDVVGMSIPVYQCLGVHRLRIYSANDVLTLSCL